MKTPEAAPRRRRSILLVLLGNALFCAAPAAGAGDSVGGTDQGNVLARGQEAVVKLYGAGGFAGLEGYQTGVFVDDSGAVLTVDSPVLDGGAVAVVDAFGDRYEGRVEGVDRSTGLALIRSQSIESPPGWVELSSGAEPARGERLWVLTNAFKIAAGEEPLTVQQARAAGRAPMPVAGGPLGGSTRAAIGAPTPGTPVLLIGGVTSNPGAGGSLVIDASGAPVGVVGAECRAESTGAWVNYALPASVAAEALARLEQGSAVGPNQPKAATYGDRLAPLGVVLIPEITRRTPAYVEGVVPGSPAAEAGVRADDLIVAVGGVSVGSRQAAQRAAAELSAEDGPVELLVLREGRVIRIQLLRADQ